MQLLVHTNREESAADAEVSALFRNYYRQLQLIAAAGSPMADKRRGKLGQIARLVRALHVGHYFHDANGRLNTMVLLNRLLIDCGFSPVLMNRTDIFGGAFSEKELVAALEVGFQAFAIEVGLAHVDFADLAELSFRRSGRNPPPTSAARPTVLPRSPRSRSASPAERLPRQPSAKSRAAADHRSGRRPLGVVA